MLRRQDLRGQSDLGACFAWEDRASLLSFVDGSGALIIKRFWTKDGRGIRARPPWQRACCAGASPRDWASEAASGAPKRQQYTE